MDFLSLVTVGLVVLLGAVAVLAGWYTMCAAADRFVDLERKKDP